MAKSVIERALELYNDESFRFGPAHPQGWDFAVSQLGYRKSLAQYWWENAYTEARLERAVQAGKAEVGYMGIVYTAISDEYRKKLEAEYQLGLAESSCF